MKTILCVIVTSWVASCACGQAVPDEGAHKIKRITILVAQDGTQLNDRNLTVRVGANVQLKVMAAWADPSVTDVTDKARLSVDDPAVGTVDDNAVFVARASGKTVVKAVLNAVRNGDRDDLIDPDEPVLVKSLVAFTDQITLTVTADGDAGPKAAPEAPPAEANSVEIGKCRIAALSLYAWRDWMPIVEKPHRDGGSPLYAKVKLTLDNSKGDATKLAFRAAVVDDKRQQHDVKFTVLPNFRVLPEEVQKSYRDLDEKTQKDLIAKYNVVWDGSLKPGEAKGVELRTLEGPYLPVGSGVYVQITWTDPKGQSVVLKTPKCMIMRTD